MRNQRKVISTAYIERRIGLKASHLAKLLGGDIDKIHTFFDQGHAEAVVRTLLYPAVVNLFSDMPRAENAKIHYWFSATRKYFFNLQIDKVPTEHKNKYGRRKWTVSKRYETLKAKRKELYRKQAAVRRLSHQMLVYKVLSFGTDIHVEKMNFAALAKRAKETKKSKKTGKFLSKKRSGKSLANRAPAMFIEMLQLKVVAVGGTLHKSNTYKIKASQIDHQTKECVKKTLDQRYHHLQDGTKIQRDFYSAFIEEHVDEANNVVDFEACNRDFPNFYKMYQVEMNRLTAYEGYLPSSLGIKRNPHERKNLRPQECSNNQQPQIA